EHPALGEQHIAQIGRPEDVGAHVAARRRVGLEDQVGVEYGEDDERHPGEQERRDPPSPPHRGAGGHLGELRTISKTWLRSICVPSRSHHFSSHLWQEKKCTSEPSGSRCLISITSCA